MYNKGKFIISKQIKEWSLLFHQSSLLTNSRGALMKKLTTFLFVVGLFLSTHVFAQTDAQAVWFCQWDSLVSALMFKIKSMV